MKTLVILVIATMLIPIHAEAQNVPKTESVCVVKSSSYVVHRGQPNFTAAARDLNAFFAGPKSTGSLVVPSRAGFANATTEVIRIDADVSNCSSGDRPTMGTSSIGGCDYIGCVGSVPWEFDSMPVGSSVSMSSCGGGVQTSGTFIKQTNGLWQMTAYRTEQVTQCNPMG